MSKRHGAGTGDLFGGIAERGGAMEPLAEGAVLLRGFVATDVPGLLRALEPVLAAAPFRHMVTPGGHAMSVAMTNCGEVGWVTDRTGYRYDPIDPADRARMAGDAAAVPRRGGCGRRWRPGSPGLCRTGA